MTSSLSSLLSLPAQLLGGGATSSATASPATAGGGSSNAFGGLLSTFTSVLPNLLGAIPIIGPFISAAMPLVTGVTGALTGAQQTRTTAGNGTMDAATAAALVKYMQLQQQQASAAGATGGGLSAQKIIAANTPSATAPPDLHMTGTADQISAMQSSLNAIAMQPAGAQMFHKLDGREVDITVINDAAYAQLQQSGYTAGNGVIYVRESDVDNPNALMSTLASGLSITANQLTTLG